MRVIYVKRLTIPVLCLVFILCLVAFSKTAVAAASRGIMLWFDIVFPSLFPFFVASEILNATGFVKAAGVLFEPVMRPVFNVPGSGSFALLMGVTSGYPVGAKITCDLRKKGLVSKIEAERLLAFTNNSGPLFIIGAVATGMYGMPSLGLFLLACHILACLTVGMLFKYYKRQNKQEINIKQKRFIKRLKQEITSKENNGVNAGTLFGNAITNSITLILAIGGYIILFSVIIGILLDTGIINGLSSALSAVLSPLGINGSMIPAVLSGFFEITTGSKLANSVAGMPIGQQLAAASLIIGWAGLSVHSQVYSIASTTDISIRPYLIGKLCQGVFAAIYTWLGVRLFMPGLNILQPVLNAEYSTNGKWLETMLSSCIYLLFIPIVLIIIYLYRGASAFMKRKAN